MPENRRRQMQLLKWRDIGVADAGAVQLTQNAASGYVPSDGKLSRLRFKREQSAPNGFEAEWQAANRNFTVPEECFMITAVARLTAYFSEPHQVITLTAEAESWHLSYQGAMSVQSHVVRDSGDAQAGARFGAAPWQVGILAALLLVFEIFVGPILLKLSKQRPCRSLLIICNGPTLYSSWSLISPSSFSCSCGCFCCSISCLPAFASLACKVQRLKQIALGHAATSPDTAPPLQEASFDVGSLLVPYDERAFATATQPQGAVDEMGGEVDMEPPEEPAEALPKEKRAAVMAAAPRKARHCACRSYLTLPMAR